MMSVSVCMIVWNEEALLAQAVDSTAGLANEVVVVDTGSEDGTVAAARELGCKVLTGADRMHKAEARNTAMDAASGDWVVILDADEQIADPVGFRSFLDETDADTVYIKLAFMDGAGNPTLTYPQMRAWRRGTFHYKYRAHEVPVPTAEWGKIARTDYIWEHRPPAGRGWKSDYTLRRLQLDVEENPDDARPQYYIGRQYIYRKDWAKAEAALLCYLELGVGRDQADAWELLSRCPNRDKVADLYRACAAQPLRRDWWGSLAEHYHSLGQDVIAVGLLRCALEIVPPESTYCAFHWHGPHIHDLLARCLWKLGRYEEGYEQAKIAIEMAPDNERLQSNLRWFVGKLGQEADYYDLTYQQIVEDENRLAWVRTLADAVAPNVVGTVLDMGCGLGILADRVPDSYTGIDFSPFALEWAEAHTHNPQASFVKSDLRRGRHWSQNYGTVVLAEVLEHLSDPEAVVKVARNHATDRLIVTVPVDMPDPAHVKPAWTEDDLQALLPGCTLERITGGSRWMAIEEVNGANIC